MGFIPAACLLAFPAVMLVSTSHLENKGRTKEALTVCSVGLALEFLITAVMLIAGVIPA